MSDVGEDVQAIWPDCWGRDTSGHAGKHLGRFLKTETFIYRRPHRLPQRPQRGGTKACVHAKTRARRFPEAVSTAGTGGNRPGGLPGWGRGALGADSGGGGSRSHHKARELQNRDARCEGPDRKGLRLPVSLHLSVRNRQVCRQDPDWAGLRMGRGAGPVGLGAD